MAQTSEVLKTSEVLSTVLWRDFGSLKEHIVPRRAVPFMPDLYYHFYNRGNNRQAVFFDRDNYQYFLRGLKKYLSEQVDILAYCLMPTHYHILGRVKSRTSDAQNSEIQTWDAQTSEVVKTSDVFMGSEVSRAMQKLGISYTKAINKRYTRVGALFQGQFHGKVVENYQHLMGLCIYIHANPVKDELVAKPEDWEFSNYREWVGLRDGTLVNHAFIQDTFGTPQEYKTLVNEYLANRYLPEDVQQFLDKFD